MGAMVLRNYGDGVTGYEWDPNAQDPALQAGNNAALEAAFNAKYGAPTTERRSVNYGEGVTGFEGGREFKQTPYGYSVFDEKLGNMFYDPATGEWKEQPEASGSLFGDFITPIALFASLAAGGGALANMLGGAGAGAGAAGAGLAEGFGGAGILGDAATWGLGEAAAGAGAGALGAEGLANSGYIDALGGMTDITGTALPGWSAGTAATTLSPNLLSQLNTALGTNFSGTDVMKTLGNLAGAGLGAYASNEQTGALEDMAARYEGYGAPYRQKLSDLYANPESFLSSAEVQKPVQMGTDALMRSLSVQGNPFGSGNALQQGQSYASDQLFGKLGQEKDRLAGFGGLANYNAAAPQVATNAVQSSGNMYNAIGSGLGNIFNPPKSGAQTLADLLKQLG